MKRTLAEHLGFASRLFDAGEIVKAGQIWQAILKKEPSSAEAVSGLARVREAMAGGGADGDGQDYAGGPPAPTGSSAPWSLVGALGLPHPGEPALPEPQSAEPQPQPQGTAAPAPPPPNPEFDGRLREGCSLYDQGDPRGALRAWEGALALDPSSALALSYIRGVRRELGLPALERSPAAGAARPPRAWLAAGQTAPASPHADEVARLLEAGVKSFEKGRFGKALQDWERAYALDPENSLAKGYLDLARNEAGRLAPPKSAAAPPALLGRLWGAGGGETAPKVPRAGKEGGLSAKGTNWDGPSSSGAGRDGPSSSGAGRDGPSSSGTGRDGPSSSGAGRDRTARLPLNIVRGAALDRQLEFKKSNASPVWRLLGSRLVAGAVMAALLFAAALLVVKNVRKDARLVAARAAIREGAIKQAGQSTKTERLMPTVDELCHEARSLMHSDPLRAYLLADGAMKRDRMDASAPKLMEEARRAMLEHSAPPPSGNYARFMAIGDLDGAAGFLEVQLRRNPNDQRTRENLARVSLLKARACAAHSDWEGARSRILLGSALSPDDLEWRARLKLLDYLRAASEDERRLWIGLLG